MKKALSPAMRENIAGYLFALPWIIGFLVFIGGPIIASFLLGFTRYDILSPPRWLGLGNYANMFLDDELFWKSLYNTVYYIAFNVPLDIIGSLSIALLLNNKLKGIGFFKTVFYLPSITTAIAMAMAWLLIFDPGIGLVNSVLRGFGIQGPLWFKSETWARPTMILVKVLEIGGPRMVVFLAGLQSIPDALYEAADIDGASLFTKFRRITVPLLSPIILYNVIISIIQSFKVFINAYIITEGGPLNETMFFVLYIYNNAFLWLKMGYASALATLFFVIILCLTAFQLWFSRKWVYYASDKK